MLKFQFKIMSKIAKLDAVKLKPAPAVMLRWAVAGALCCIPTAGFAQAVDTQRAQLEMITRVEKTIDAYAFRLNAGAPVVAYCRVQLQLDTRNATDGTIPFGVNYNAITTQQQLKNVLYAREAYETTYLKLCIARAKRDLDAAERP